MNPDESKFSGQKPPTFAAALAAAWRRGWKVFWMIIVIQLMSWVCFLPVYLFPEAMHTALAVVLLFFVAPLIYYVGFRMFYPDYVFPVKTPEPEPILCPTCRSRIPASADTCSRCGWTYRAP